MLSDLAFKSVYKSDEDNILEEFYVPALSVATQYDRAVGFFSASTISYAGQALSTFVANGGKIRLILGAFTDKADIEAVQNGYDRRALSEKIGTELLEIVSNVSDELFQNRFEALAWLVAHGRLDVKIALRERGMFHDKVGIITDTDGESVVFAGSANESTHALLPTFNYESINVLDLPTAVEERLVAVARDMNYTPAPEIEQAIAGRIRAKVRDTARSVSSMPRLPRELAGRPFKMQDHQLAALEAWKSKGDFQGIFDLATGAGKTITAIYSVCKLAEQGCMCAQACVAGIYLSRVRIETTHFIFTCY